LVRISAGIQAVSTEVFVAFLRYQAGTWIRRRPLASRSFPIHRSPVILPFDDGKTEILKCGKIRPKKKVEEEGREREDKENREQEKKEVE
jgi:hypothetical protein